MTEKSAIFKESQNAKVEDNCQSQVNAAAAQHRLGFVIGVVVDEQSEEIIDQRAFGEQEDEAPVPEAVEKVTGCQQDKFPRCRALFCHPRQDEDDEEENCEFYGGKQHPCVRPPFQEGVSDAGAAGLAKKAI